MEENQQIPITVEFYREVQKDLSEKFHPFMEGLQNTLKDNQLNFREEMLGNGFIGVFDAEDRKVPALGIDAGVATNDHGEMACAIAASVISSTIEDIKPKYFFESIYGTASETFNKVGGCLRVVVELLALSEVCGKGHWVFYDGSFTSLNFDLCKFAASMPNDLNGANPLTDFAEWQQLKTLYQKCLCNPYSDWFKVFGEYQAENLISVSKRGVSKYWTKQLKSLSNIHNVAYLPSDKMLLDMILKPGEYTRPISYEEAFMQSHGSKVSGYGKPSTGKESFVREHQNVESTFKRMEIVVFKPHPWSKAMSIQYNGDIHELNEVLGIVKAHTVTKSVMEPLPLYLADLLSKQVSSTIELYGPVNVGKYPYLFKAQRTSSRF